MKQLIRLTTLQIILVSTLLSMSACSKHLFPVKQEHHQYAINSDITPDSAYISYYLPYKQQLEATMNRVVGHADADLTKPASTPETLLGNFFAEALLAEGKKLYPEVDFSFGTKGGLRIELQKGDITVGHIFELMPFENELVVLELSGENVQQLAQFIASTGGQPVAGLRMNIHEGQAAAIEIAGQSLDKSKTYHLLTYDYLANGGDNLRGLDSPVNRINLQKKVREALIDYVSQHTHEGKHINTQLDGRITRAQ